MQTNLVTTSAALARRSPQEWRAFVEAYNDHVLACKDGLVTASPDALQIAQGRAQESVAMLQLLNNCLSTAEKLGNK